MGRAVVFHTQDSGGEDFIGAGIENGLFIAAGIDDQARMRGFFQEVQGILDMNFLKQQPVGVAEVDNPEGLFIIVLSIILAQDLPDTLELMFVREDPAAAGNILVEDPSAQ